MTTSTYRFLRETEPDTFNVNVTAGVSSNLGDLMKWDTTNRWATPMTAAADATNFIGVCEGQIPVASNIDNASGLETRVRIKGTGVFSFKSTSGDTYSHGDTVALGADVQTVAKSGSNVLGYAWLPLGNQVVGGAGTEVTVKILKNFPDAKFSY